VLVTGASGFVGAVVARGIAAQGYAVHCPVRDPAAWRLRGLAGTVHLHPCDLLDEAATSALVDELRPHGVLHLAAYGAYESQSDARRIVRTNLEATVTLLDACARAGVERFVNTGSSSEYGYQDHAPDEDEALEPNSLYAVTKAAASAYVRHAGRSGRLRTVTLRLYSVYGPWEEPSRLIPSAIVRGLAGGYPPLAEPEIARDFVYAGDVVGAYAAALAADLPAGAVYNVGTGVQTTLRTVAEISRRRFGLAADPAWGTMARRKWDTTTWVANVARARTELGWRASTSFEEGFGRTADWIGSDPERLRFYRTARPPLDQHA
jgi:dolichol-phosphate mannosyltransferase